MKKKNGIMEFILFLAEFWFRGDFRFHKLRRLEEEKVHCTDKEAGFPRPGNYAF